MTNKPRWCYRHLLIYTIMLLAFTFVGFAVEIFLLPFNEVSLAGAMLLEKMNVCHHPVEATKLLWEQVKERKG